MPFRYFCLALPFLFLATPASALEGCFCAKDNLSDRKCGQVERFDPADSVTLREYSTDAAGGQRLGAPITLSFLNFTECPKPEKPAVEITADPVPVTGDEAFGVIGSNTIGEVLMPMLIKGYARLNGLDADGEHCNAPFRLTNGDGKASAITIRCEARGSGTGIPALADQRADLAMLSRPISPSEQERLAVLGFNRMTSVPYESVIALDGLRVIVSPQNPVSALSVEQIARIFSGEITDWSQVGGQAGRISLYARDTRSGTRDTFDKLVLDPARKQVAASAQLFESSTGLSGAVERDPSAIGFVGFAYRGANKTLAISEPCGIRHEPSAIAYKAEDHPLSRRLYLYRARLTSRHAQELLSFAISDAAQQIISDAGYINQTIEAWDAARTRQRIADYADAPTKEPQLDIDTSLLSTLEQDTAQAQRLSISFRFRFGSSELDSKASDDIVRLARYLQDEAGGKRVLLLGFADAVGAFGPNRQLSQARAVAVRNALIGTGSALDRSAIITRGYSELLPVACNTSELGRQKNRRVEVYLAD